MTPTLSSLKVCYWGCHWKLVRSPAPGEAADEWWGCCMGRQGMRLPFHAGRAAVWGPAPSPSEMQPKQLGTRDKRTSRLWNLQGMFEKPDSIKPRKREKGEIQLWPIIEKTSTALTQLKWQWNQRCGLQGLSSLAIKKTNCSLVRADQYTRWQRVSQSKCRAVSHPPQTALSLDKSQRDSSGSKKECRKGQRQ